MGQSHAGDVDEAIPTLEGQEAQPSEDSFTDLFDKAASTVTAEPDETDDGAEGIDEADESEGEPEEQTAEEDPEARKPRSLKHKELLEQNVQLQERFTEFEQKFEEQGGFDTVENAVNFYALASDPTKVGEFTKALAGLPHFRQQQAAMFQDALSDPANRVMGLNNVLKEDFGLQTPITQTQIEKVLEYVVERFNDDPEDFETFLDRSLELADTPERRVARLEAENAKLKSGVKTTTESTDGSQEPDSGAMFARVQEMGDRLDDEQFAAAYDKVAADYGLKPSSKDPVAFKEAKATMSDLLRIFASYEMRNAKAFEPLLAYWMEGNTDQNPHYANQVRLYGKAMNARVQALIKKISPLFSGVQVPPSKPGQLGSNLGQKTSLVPQGEKQQSRENRGRSPFDDAFDKAASTLRS